MSYPAQTNRRTPTRTPVTITRVYRLGYSDVAKPATWGRFTLERVGVEVWFSKNWGRVLIATYAGHVRFLALPLVKP